MGRKVLGYGFLVMLALVLIFFVALAVTPDKREGFGAVCFVLGLLALLLSFMAWRCFKSATKTSFQWDVLKQTLSVSPVPENNGVQWMMLAYPDTIQTPGHLVLALLAQNCYSTGRRVRIEFQSPDPRVAPDSQEFLLEGGHAGIHRIPLLLPGGLAEGPLLLKFSVDPAIPEGKGIRVIETHGIAPRSALHFRQLTIEILPGNAAAAPLNEFARNWAGFQPIFATGQAQPDLEPLRLLEELRSTS
jgi:hypothetical protein